MSLINKGKYAGWWLYKSQNPLTAKDAKLFRKERKEHIYNVLALWTLQ
jgi:hypothetical protein